MIHGVGPGTAVKRIGICQKGPGTHLPQQFRHSGSVIVTQESHVAQFPKMDLNGCKFIFTVQGFYAGRFDQKFHFFWKASPGSGFEIRKKDFAHTVVFSAV